MPLQEDQRALLALLLSGERYEEIAELTGTDRDAVRLRTREALAEIGGRDPDELIEGLSDELVGQAGESEAAAVRARLADDPEARALADRIARGLDDLADRSAPGSTASVGPPRHPAPGAPPSRVQLIRRGAILLGVVVIAVVAVVVTGVFSSDSGTTTTSATVSGEDVTQIRLVPAAGSKAHGTAKLLPVEDIPVLDIDVRDLPPSGPGRTYIVWLTASGGRAVPIALKDVGPDGRFTGRIKIPSAVSALLPAVDTLDLSLASTRDAATVIESAAHSKTLPQHVGITMASGTLR